MSRLLVCFCIGVLVSTLAAAPAIVPAAEAPADLTPEEAAEDALTAAMFAPWSGDLDGMIRRGYVRIGVADEPLFFGYDGAEQEGLTVDSAREFEKHLRETLGAEAATLTVTLAPLPRDVMLDALVAGRVDILAANLTVTPERAARVDFSAPMIAGVAEIVVTGPAAPDIASLDDLATVPLRVRPSSSYFEHLAALNAQRVAEGLAAIAVEAADENLEDFDLAELVHVGAIPAMVMDDHKARLYAQVFEHLVLHEDIAVSSGGEIGWAIRRDSPELMAAVNGYREVAKKGTLLGNILFKRWFGSADRIRNALAPGEAALYAETIDMIRRYAGEYDFDAVLVAAQGYQESGLDQSKRSSAGAVGIMQLMPATAADPVVGIPDIEVADRNVEAGVKYLRHLRDVYFDDPEIPPLDRMLFSFAAYNAGPGNIARARKRAAAMGLDPEVWFGNVEIAAAKTVSREPVVYVRNILKYYTCYKIYEEAG